MMRLTLLICALFIVGCGSRTQINYGADLAVYVGSSQHMFECIPKGIDKSVYVLHGYYSPDDGSITISEQLNRFAMARVFAHELAHAYDHQKPRDMWELLARYQSTDFDFNPHKESK